MGVAPVVVEAPALGELAIGLVFLLAWLVTAGLLWGYTQTIGALLEKLANALVVHVGGIRFVTHGFTIDLGGPIRSVNHAIVVGLGDAASGAQAQMGRAFHAAARLAEWGAHEVELLAGETAAFGEWLLRVHLPRWAKILLAATLSPAAITLLIAREIRQHGAGVVKVVEHAVAGGTTTVYRDVSKPVRAEVARLETRVKALEAEAAAAVALPVPHVGRIEHDAGALAQRVRSLGWAGAFAGVAALGLAILAKLGLGWTRCANVRNVGRRLCGMNPAALESLLAGAVLITSAISIVDFAKVMLAAEDEIVSGLRRGFRELHGVEPLQFEGYTGTLG